MAHEVQFVTWSAKAGSNHVHRHGRLHSPWAEERVPVPRPADEQRKLFRPILARHSGREVKIIGDAFFVEFSSALDAIRCAYDVQRATREYNFSLPEERRIHLRVGIHLGDVVESAGDISGDAVNVASRIE